MAVVDRPRGRAENKKSKSGAAKQPNLDNYYLHTLQGNVGPDAFNYFLTLKKRGRPSIKLDRFVESISWDDSDTAMTGSVVLNRPGGFRSLSVSKGHEFILRVKWQGRMYEIWRMRAGDPEIDVTNNQITVPIADELQSLGRSRRDWSFRKTKLHKKGWRADEITRAVARKIGVKVGRLAKGTTRFTLKKKKTSGLGAILAAYSKEKEHSARRFVIRLRNGRLEITPYKRNTILNVLSNQIEAAAITYSSSNHPATAITVKGWYKVNGKKKSRSFTAINRQAARRLGYKHRTIKAGQVDSYGEIKTKAKRALAKSLRVKKTVNITHSAIPFTRRGDGIKVNLPSEGITGADAYFYVTAVSFNITGSERTMDVQLTQDDPFVKSKKTREKELRDKKRKKRKR